ncbi:hypothetical protein [Kineobactrum salinum]|uniref:Uncharacterized protein n=1 Tax=Kineobactrum salinum TaxID=2708301 RepID=A0A6C0TYE4_9GAMM|nr:hypothetical protein [Kineobactrum salinum]QIB64821.1 hypothetical protein G3T16_04875 [Kineobactrum salinum]
MKYISRALILLAIPLFTSGAWAETTQDCILEGTVDKKKAVQTGRDVYVTFHSASRAEKNSECTLNRRNRVEFKEPKNAMIENAPDGAKVKYRYTKEENQDGEWQLMDMSMQ